MDSQAMDAHAFQRVVQDAPTCKSPTIQQSSKPCKPSNNKNNINNNNNNDDDDDDGNDRPGSSTGMAVLSHYLREHNRLPIGQRLADFQVLVALGQIFTAKDMCVELIDGGWRGQISGR
jgi:hypothetical protein